MMAPRKRARIDLADLPGEVTSDDLKFTQLQGTKRADEFEKEK
jgi:hypothetical protein